MTNKETYAATYSQAFIDAYPQLPAENARALIEKALSIALEDIRSVNIDGAAFKAVSKKLGIKHTYKDIQAYLNA